MTAVAELAQLAAEATVWRDLARAEGCKADAGTWRGRADCYRMCARTLRDQGPGADLVLMWLTAEHAMGAYAAHCAAAGRHAEAAWCTGYQRALEDAAELVAEHVEETP